MLERSSWCYSYISADKAPSRANPRAHPHPSAHLPSPHLQDLPPEGIAKVCSQTTSIEFCGVQLKCDAGSLPKYSVTLPILDFPISSPSNQLCNSCSELWSAGYPVIGQDLLNAYTEMLVDNTLILPRPICLIMEYNRMKIYNRYMCLQCSVPNVLFQVTEVSWRDRHHQHLSSQCYSWETSNYNKFNKEERNPFLCFHGQLP